VTKQSSADFTTQLLFGVTSLGIPNWVFDYPLEMIMDLLDYNATMMLSQENNTETLRLGDSVKQVDRRMG